MRLAFVMNPVRGGWSPADPESWAGGEEVATGMTRAFAARGHAVTVIWDSPALMDGAVEYVNHAEVGRRTFDAALFFKCPELGAQYARIAPIRMLWTDQERAFNPDPFQLVGACSLYLGRYLASLVPRCTDKLDVMPYAYDNGELLRGMDTDRWHDPWLVLATSSPDRGLATLLGCWPAILEKVPDAVLRVTYGWEQFDKIGGPIETKRQIERLLSGLPAHSVTFGRVSRDELHRLYWQAAVWAYYCTGGEQFGLSAIKAQAAGCIPIVKPWGALHETVWSGIKVNDAAGFTNALLAALDLETQERLRAEVMATPSIFKDRTFDDVAALWEERFADPSPAISHSHLREVQPSPPFINPPGWNAAMVAAGHVNSWLQQAKAATVWIDPALAIGTGNVGTAAEAAAVVLGYELETEATAPAATLEALNLQTGAAVICLTSTGPWRAAQRRRVLYRRDLMDIVGKLPDVQVFAAPLEPAGNGVVLTTFRYLPGRIGTRDLARASRGVRPRQTVGIAIIVRNGALTLPRTLDSISGIADQICVINTGSTDATDEIVSDWGRRHGIPTKVAAGTAPRFCHDCVREHEIGEMGHGCRFAGFETPRNQSLALVDTDWAFWIDADELLVNPDGLTKYLRANLYQGYSVPQDHHSCDPPEGRRRDYPVRLFRIVKERPPGWISYGPLGWPTFDAGLRMQFTGVVHEHPGVGPDYTEGLGPTIIVSDAWLSHEGYLCEQARRKRFVRNWPLMVADRQKYPQRRLGTFLWLRDLNHQMRYMLERSGRVLSPTIVEHAEECIQIFDEHFVTKPDHSTLDALSYATLAMELLKQGEHYEVIVRVRKPELTPDPVEISFSGRFLSFERMLMALEARKADLSGLCGPYL